MSIPPRRPLTAIVATVALLGVAASSSHAADHAPAPAPGLVTHIKVLSDKVPDVSNLEAWKKSYITAGMSDQEKAIAVWKTVSTFQHQDGPPAEYLQHEDLVYDPIKLFNVYGYAMCCNASAHEDALARYLGFEARGWAVHHHSICEIKYGDAWHHFDASLICYFPKLDGVVASIDEITKDVLAWYAKHPEQFDGTHGIDKKLREFEFQDGRTGWKKGPDILLRAPTYNAKGWWPAGTHGWYATMEVFDGTAGDRPAYHYEYAASQGYQLNIQLRRGERLTRNWSNKGLHVNMNEGGGPGCMEDKDGFLKKYDAAFGSLAPGRVGNGTLEYTVPLADGSLADAAFAIDNVSTTSADGKAPAVHAKDAAKPASFVLRMPSSYVYLGGQLALTSAVGKDGHVVISFSDNNGLDWKPVADLTKSGESTIDLKPLVFRRYDYRLKFELSGVGTGVDALKISHDIQHSQRPLPALDAGDNAISFSAGSTEGTITVEASTRTDHVGKQVLFTDFHPVVAGLSGSPLAISGAEGSLTVPIATPGDMIRLRFGCHYQNASDKDSWDLEASFDNGKTFTKVASAPWQEAGRTAWTAVEAPKGTRAAQVRFAGKKASNAILWSFRIDADYIEPKAGLAPITVSYHWEEDGQAKEDVHTATKADESWKITCAKKPLMKSIVIERSQ